MATVHFEDALTDKIDNLVKSGEFTQFKTRKAFIEYHLTKVIDEIIKKKKFNQNDISIKLDSINPDTSDFFVPRLRLSFDITNNSIYPVILDRIIFKLEVYVTNWVPGLGEGICFEKVKIPSKSSAIANSFFKLNYDLIEMIDDKIGNSYDIDINWRLNCKIYYLVETIGDLVESLNFETMTINSIWKRWRDSWFHNRRNIEEMKKRTKINSV